MGLAVTTVEIPGGKVGDLVAEHLMEHCDRCRRELHR
jgi:hypothetical protein